VVAHSELSVAEFRSKYELKEPVLIRGAVKSWPAARTWLSRSFLQLILSNITLLGKPVSRLPVDHPIEGDEATANIRDGVDPRPEGKPKLLRWNASDYLSDMRKKGVDATMHNPSYVFADLAKPGFLLNREASLLASIR
jgi:hypothetical protein